MIRYLITLEGRVQGVGLRYFVQSYAGQYNLSGWVKNMEDGTVQLAIQGEEEDTSKMFRALREGTQYIRIDNMHLLQLPVVDGSIGFRIL